MLIHAYAPIYVHALLDQRSHSEEYARLQDSEESTGAHRVIQTQAVAVAAGLDL